MEIRSPDKKKKRIYVLKSIPSCVLAGKALHAWLGFYTECEILLPPLLTPSWLQLRWAERRSSSNTNKNITKQLLSDIIEWLHLILLMYVHLCLFLVLCTLLHQYCWRWRMPQEMVGFGADSQGTRWRGRELPWQTYGWGVGSRAHSFRYSTVTPGQHYLHPADRQS